MDEPARDSFVKKLQQTASYRAIPIDHLGCRDLPDKDGFELTVKSGVPEVIDDGVTGFIVETSMNLSGQ